MAGLLGRKSGWRYTWLWKEKLPCFGTLIGFGVLEMLLVLEWAWMLHGASNDLSLGLSSVIAPSVGDGPWFWLTGVKWQSHWEVTSQRWWMKVLIWICPSKSFGLRLWPMGVPCGSSPQRAFWFTTFPVAILCWECNQPKRLQLSVPVYIYIYMKDYPMN
jgi:hypothetical protein